MSIAYLISQKEMVVLKAMVCKREWEGNEKQLKPILEGLIQKKYVFKKDNTYTLERVIYGLIQIIEQTPEEQILTNGDNILYINLELWIFLEKDKRSTNNYKLKVFEGRKAFKESEESKEFLEM